MTATFLLTSLVIVATPGTGVLHTVAAGLTRGPRAATLAALACTWGTVPHAVAALTGLAALLHASGVAFGVVKYAGVVYLMVMAWSTWHDDTPLDQRSSDANPTPRAGRVLLQGVTMNLLNPKLTLFFVAFLPQFVPPATDGASWDMVLLTSVFMVMTFLVFAAYGLLAAATRERVLTGPRVVGRLRRGFASAFAVLGVRLALETP